ncbi:MAG TPA: hypothetical protein PLN91_00805 [Rhodanobacteraceae bacterium]|nr:hypothetical protein [Rhodanobacteraceae bacterium]
MCSEVLIRLPGGVEIICSTVGEVAEALDLPAAAVSPDPPEFCLCNAHWATLGARCATMDEGFPHPGYVIEVA